MDPRIAPLEEPYADDVAAELAAMMPPGVPPLKLFRTLAHSPRILKKVRLANLLDRGPVDRRDRELVILRTCARCGSEYEWGVHVAVFAARVGLTEDEVRATVCAESDDPVWSERDAVLMRMADALHDASRLDPFTWEGLRRHWNDDQVLELIVLAGFYHTISFLTNGLAIELEDGGRRFPGR
jgi:alkylhydroperoxidase family enzyme